MKNVCGLDVHKDSIFVCIGKCNEHLFATQIGIHNLAHKKRAI